RAASGRLESELPSLPLRQRQERWSMMRDDLFVRRDDRLAGEKRRPNPLGRRLDSTDRFDNDVGVACEHVFEARGPDDVAAQRRTARRRLSIRQRIALGNGAAIEDEGQLETGDGIRTGEAYGDRGTDGAEAEDG